jgi:cellulose synthase/poly-beta-1,6-N-acetylglucosamine synthase-like glycosyltransferase
VIVTAALWVLAAAGLVVFICGIVKLSFVPLAVVGDTIRIRRDARGEPTALEARPLVSVIIPAYNEEKVLGNCVRSILRSEYRSLEVLIIDDGSTDDTASLMADLAAGDRRISALSQPNAGKGAALNTGIAHARGEVLFFVDADGLFAPNTVSEMLRGLHSPEIGAVCGDDRPINLDRVQTKMLTILSHVGTGLVRRALVVLHVLPIVSGNIGAFPRSVIDEVGGFREDTVGEDLELTWRVQMAGYQVEFRPTALVYAESPSTLAGLWRQRVRWARGLLQTMRLHRRAIGNPRHGAFGIYLGFNSVNAVLVPVLQLLLLVGLPLLFVTGNAPFDLNLVAVLLWLGLATSLVIVLIAVSLNHALRDLRFLWTIALWPAYSVMMACVMVAALWKERSGAPAEWNKLERTGVVSIDGLTEGSGGRPRGAASMGGDAPGDPGSGKPNDPIDRPGD